MAFITHSVNGVVFLTSTLLDGVPHGFSTRRGGVSRPPWDSLNLGPGRGDDPGSVRENYRRFCAAVGEAYSERAANAESVTNREAKSNKLSVFIDPKRAVLAKQVHETAVRPVTEADAGKGLYRERDYTSADALVTDAAYLPLVVFSADCGILLLYDSVSGAVGAVHAGWRGCAGGIVEKAVRQMETLYGADAENLRAAIGPCIGPCCFETDGDVPDAMRRALGTDAEPYLVPPTLGADAEPYLVPPTLGADAEPYLVPPAPELERRGKLHMDLKWHVDLAALNRLWLLRAGLLPENIDVCGICTACHPADYWSHRKMGEARGVQTALIMREAVR